MSTPSGSAPLLFPAIEAVIAQSDFALHYVYNLILPPEFAHCGILQPQELCMMLCSSYNFLEKFMQLYAFISGIQNWTETHSFSPLQR